MQGVRRSLRGALGALAVGWAIASPTVCDEPKDTRSVAERVDGLLKEAVALLGQHRRWAADEVLAKTADLARDGGLVEGEIAALEGRLEVLEELGQWALARDVATRKLAVEDRIGDHVTAAATEASLAGFLAYLGDLSAAQSRMHHAAERAREHGAEDVAVQLEVNLALVRLNRGRFAEAAATLARAQEFFEERHDTSRLAVTLTVLAVMQQETGLYAKAIDTNQRVLELLGSEASVERAQTRGRIGSALVGLGEFAGAREELRLALNDLESLGNPIGEVSALLELGELALREAREDSTRPRALHEEARTWFAKAEARGGTEALHAEALADLADAEVLLGKVDEGIAHHRSAFAVATEIQDADLLARVHRGLAHANLAKGDLPTALRHARHAVRAVAALSEGLSDQERIALRASDHFEAFEIGIRVALAMKDPDALGDFLEMERAGGLLDSLGGRRALRGVVVPEALDRKERSARESELAALGRLQALRERGVSGADLRAARQEIDRARADVDAAIQQIQRDARRAAAIAYPTPSTLRELRIGLGAGEVLVLYALLRDTAFALVAAREEARIVPLSSSAVLEAACAAFERGPKRGGEGPAALERLGQLTLAPLGLPPGTRTVLLGPDGALCNAPLVAAAELALPKEVTVSLVPSGSTYRLLAEERKREGSRVLALGDPAYPQEVPAGNDPVLRGRRLPRLPGTRDEVLAVTTEADLRLLGADASRGGFQRAVGKERRWGTVHLGCHGLIDRKDPFLSALALTPVPGDDGLLLLRDVFGLVCPSDLVVLSACDTGLGPVARGEGIVGFTRAFMYAGAPRVVVSLWNVEDDATKAFMKAFYAAMDAGRPAAAALRDAQRLVRGEPAWSDPSYWAAWVLWGLPD